MDFWTMVSKIADRHRLIEPAATSYFFDTPDGELSSDYKKKVGEKETRKKQERERKKRKSERNKMRVRTNRGRWIVNN